MTDPAPRLSRESLSRRVAEAIEPGSFVNLGVGIPTLVSNYVSPDRCVMIHSENGVIGAGPAPEPGHEIPDLVNAGGQPTTLVPGASLMDSAASFAIIRGGHLDVAVLGALQVAENGDLANWRRSGRRAGSIGGAADLAAGARELWVAMEHNVKDGTPKIVRRCTYPLTGSGVVRMIFTDVAVIRVSADGLVLEEHVPGWSFDNVQSVTEAPLRASPTLRAIGT